jgi:hypothetical protein
MTLSHLRSELLSANVKWYSLSSSVRSSFTVACRALTPAALSHEITVLFCPGKPAAALRSLALMKGFPWGSTTNTASWAGLDTHHNPVPWRLPACSFLQYFCNHALAIGFGIPYSSLAVLALNLPSSAKATTCSWTDLSWWTIVMKMKEAWLELHIPSLTYRR